MKGCEGAFLNGKAPGRCWCVRVSVGDPDPGSHAPGWRASGMPYLYGSTGASIGVAGGPDRVSGKARANVKYLPRSANQLALVANSLVTRR